LKYRWSELKPIFHKRISACHISQSNHEFFLPQFLILDLDFAGLNVIVLKISKMSQKTTPHPALSNIT